MLTPDCWREPTCVERKSLEYKDLSPVRRRESGNALCYLPTQTALVTTIGLQTKTEARRLRPVGIWLRLALEAAVVIVLLCLGAANIAVRSWTETDDGVLWVDEGDQVAARAVDDASPGARAAIREGDVLLAIDGRPIESARQVQDTLHASHRGDALTYTVLRLHSQEMLTLIVTDLPAGSIPFYYALAAVGVFTLLVGGSVRLRKPDNQATLHFFWLCVAFFGVMSLSYSGRLNTLDQVFYWGDAIASLMLPPLFLHFALMFPDRPDAWARTDAGRSMMPLLYLPALLLGGARVAAFARGNQGEALTILMTLADRGELLYLAACCIAGLIVMTRALRRVRSVTSRRQLRWIVWGTGLGTLPFVLAYGLPFGLGFTPIRGTEFTALLLVLVPLGFASAIVRYRLMDVEVIIKRALVYAAALAGMAAIYAIILKLASEVFFGGGDPVRNPVIALLATIIVALLLKPLKNTIQAVLDRVYYRDRYDYRRALVGFARDLNSDLDLFRLAERLVHRVMETLVVDRMALMLAPAATGREGDFVTIAHAGFAGSPPALAGSSEAATRLISGHTLTLDDPLVPRRVSPREIEFWREAGIHYFVPCVSKEGTIAVMALGRKASTEPLSSEDMALLAAVAAQAATALENGRLYRQLRMKADEL
jgi:two-component system, NtrC family, sensor kinase